MKGILRKYFIIVTSIVILIQIVSAFRIERGMIGLLYVAFIFSVIYYMLKPVINLIMFPVNIITLNLFSWIINITLFFLWTLIVKDIHIYSWAFSGFKIGPVVLSSYNFSSGNVYIISAILINLIINAVSWLLK